MNLGEQEEAPSEGLQDRVLGTDGSAEMTRLRGAGALRVGRQLKRLKDEHK